MDSKRGGEMKRSMRRGLVPLGWADLPKILLVLVLERLTISDYLRCGAVCRAWCATQKEHLLHSSPSPPTLLLPWVLLPELKGSTHCLFYSPFESRYYKIQLPKAQNWHCFAAFHGWLLLSDAEREHHLLHRWLGVLPNPATHNVSLMNPISGVEIPLPRLFGALKSSVTDIAISSLPTDPRCVFMVATTQRKFYFWRFGESGRWSSLQHHEEGLIKNFIYFECKFHATNDVIGTGLVGERLVVVDPHSTPPTLDSIQMSSPISMPSNSLFPLISCLVECRGELLCVVASYNEFEIGHLRVHQADLSQKVWREVGSIGDRILVVGHGFGFELSAADVGIPGNRIYYVRPRWYRAEYQDTERKVSPPIWWIEYDLERKRTIVRRPSPSSIVYDPAQFKYDVTYQWMVPMFL